MKKNCEGCDALCCRYVAMQIDTPTCKEDWDKIIWYLHHENILIFVDHEDDWMIEFKTKCKNLLPNNKCDFYETRPKICRVHGAEECEHNNDDSPYKLLFKNVEELQNYLDEKKINYKFKRLPK